LYRLFDGLVKIAQEFFDTLLGIRSYVKISYINNPDFLPDHPPGLSSGVKTLLLKPGTCSPPHSVQITNTVESHLIFDGLYY